ncbi:OsmC family protein [Acidithiobacillus ferriphilus]|uniref:OsmC family protein n=1 Tax=Acidithiobacillus ferriphilus TaxID=1689834 RepID=UPI00390C921F
MVNNTALNGVDINQLGKTVQAVKDNTALAKCQFRTTTQWISGAHAQTHVQGFYGLGQEYHSRSTPFIIESDEPTALMGTNKGANPVELLLTGLAACITVGLVYNAAARGISLDELKIEISGEIDLQGFMGLSESVRPGFNDISVYCHLKSASPDSDLLDLIEYVKRVSPVHNTISQPTPVEVIFQRL